VKWGHQLQPPCCAQWPDELDSPRLGLLKQHAKFLQPPDEQRADGPVSATHLTCYLGNSDSPQMVQLDGRSLVRWELGQRFRQLEELFLPDGSLAWRGLIRCNPGFESCRRTLQKGFQRLFPRYVAPGGAQLAHFVGQIVGQDLPKPRCPLDIIPSLKPVERLVELPKGLLDDPRQVDLPMKTGVDLKPG
jgi:hypothetical protein